MTQSNPKVPVAVQRRKRQLVGIRDKGISILKDLTPERIEKALLMVLESPGPDGYPRSSLPESSIASGRLGDPTGQAVAQLAGGKLKTLEDGSEEITADTWQEPIDPVAEALQTFQRALFGAVNELLDSAERALGGVERVVREAQRPQSPNGTCPACGRPVSGLEGDRWEQGYCHSCRMAWDRADRPDRAWFERNRPQWSRSTPDEPEDETSPL